MAPRAVRSTRDRPAKAPLSERVVVDAALDVLRAEGPEAVTMRRVAQALDTGPASLYVYVANREGLLEAMLARVTASVALERPDPARWLAQLRDLLVRLHAALTAHPGLTAMTPGAPLTAEPILALNENLLGLMAAGGLDPQDAAWACDSCILVVTAAAREARRPPADPGAGGSAGEQLEALRRTFAELPRDRYPHLAAHAGPMVAGDGSARFGFALDLLLDGLAARAAPDRRGAGPGR